MARRASRLGAGLLVAVTALAPSVPASAAPADDVNDRKRSVDSQIAQLKDQLEGASDDLVDAAVKLRKLQAQLGDARAVLTGAQRARADAARKDAEIGARLEFAQAQYGKARNDLEAERAAAEQTRGTLARIARDTYVGDGLSGLSVALQATTPEQFTERMAVAGAALRAQGGAIDRMAVVESELRTKTAKLGTIQAQIAELKQASAAVVAERQAAERQAASAASQVNVLVADQNAEVAAIQGKIDAEKKRLADLEAEQAKLRAILVERARKTRESSQRRRSGGWTPPASGGYLSYPVSASVTSSFGMRYHPILHYSRLHTGIDFGVGCGTPVHAAADGEIVSAGAAGGYGNRVVVDHGAVGSGDLATTYNHLSRIVVHGGSVRRGQVIAYSGTTGLSTGCHLHFETLLDGRYVNPMGYL